jgi:CubicO group peptidase (beta-lactamase class C family)
MVSARRSRAASAIALAAAATTMLLAQSGGAEYFPDANGSWHATTPGRLGWRVAALEDAADYAARQKSTALVIVHDGHLVLERYWQRDDVPRVASTSEGWPIEDVASLQKSFISLLVGIAIDRNLLKLTVPVSAYLGEGWSRAPVEAERRITIYHLLSMTSGLNHNLEFVEPAGTRWHYNTPAYSLLIRVLSTVSGKDVNNYSAEWLTTGVGMVDTRWIQRQSSAPNQYGLATTARDLARMGLLVVRRGMWADRRVISESYLDDATAPSQSLNATYGLLWWRVNGQASQDTTLRRIDSFYTVPAAPADLVAGLGAGDRRVYVVPSLKLVIVRLGKAVNAPLRFDREFWKRLAAAFR